MPQFNDQAPTARLFGLARPVPWSSLLLLLCGVSSVHGDDGVSPVAFDWTDGRPILRDERLLVDEALAIVRNTPRFELFERARGLLRDRRRSVSEFRENPRQPIPIYEDIQRHPSDYRGRPVVLWGRVVGASAAEDDLSFRIVDVDVHDDDSKPAGLVLPSESALPEVGSGFATVGVFLKLGTDHEPCFAVANLTALGDQLGDDVTSVIAHETEPRREERDAYFAALVQARTSDPERLRQRAREFRDARMEKFGFHGSPMQYPTFVDMFKNRDDYLGRPVTLRGHAWSISKIPAFDPEEGDEAEYGFDALYEIQLYTPHSQTNAVTVVCSELPEGLPSSGHLDERVDGLEVTGFFFKMGRYFDQENKGRKIPIVLARTVRWNPPEVAAAELPPWVFVVTITGVALLIGVVIWLGRRDRASRRTAKQRFAGTNPDFDGIAGSPPASENHRG